MAQWIETKLRYSKIVENGAVKKVTEAYLVDALSFAEAEARITEEMKPCISGEFTVSAVKKAKIAEVMASDSGSYWYKVRAMFISLDERTGADKLTPHDFMVGKSSHSLKPQSSTCSRSSCQTTNKPYLITL